MKSLKKVLLAAFILVMALSFPPIDSTQAQTPVLKTVQATLTWTANVETDLAGYKVYRGQGSAACNATTPLAAVVDGTGSQVIVVPTASPTFVDNTMASTDGQICYEVTAFDDAGNESPRSNRAVATLNVNPPSAPQNLNLKVVIK